MRAARTAGTGRGGRAPGRTRLVNAGLLLVSALFALAVSEAVLRWRGVVYVLDRVDADPSLGYTLIPGLHGRVDGIDLLFNSRGLRDSEYSDRPAAGVTRILFVGDSITFAQQLPPGETYVKRVGAILESTRPVETLNGGVPGYNACNEEAFYRRIGASYHPGYVVWQYCLNDVDDAWTPADARGIVPLPSNWKPALAERLVLWGFLRAQWRAVRHHLGREEVDASSLAYARRVFGLYRDAEGDRRDRAWQCIRRAEREISASGGRMLVVVVPFQMQVAGVPEFDSAPQREIERRCRENGLRCLDLLPAFRAAGDGDLFLVPDYIHLAPRGHEVAALAIADALASMMKDNLPAAGNN